MEKKGANQTGKRANQKPISNNKLIKITKKFKNNKIKVNVFVN